MSHLQAVPVPYFHFIITLSIPACWLGSFLHNCVVVLVTTPNCVGITGVTGGPESGFGTSTFLTSYSKH